MNTSSQPAHRNSAKPQSLRIIVAFAGIVVAFVTLKAPHVFLIWALDGMVAAVTLFAATCTGLGLLRLLRLGDMPRRWQILLAAGMGIGCLSLVVLACGLLGWIGEAHRYIAPGILLATGAAGWLGRASFSKANDGQIAPRWASWLLLSIAPFAALILLSATLPPGIAWQEEGRGYDVLEYHLQTPKEYYDAGQISYLPHNVYGAFPAAAEMLFLFGNQFMGETIDAWPIAKCLNALLIVLIVCAAWAIGRDTSPACGVGCAVLAGSSGWLAYLGGIAYVEGGMLLMGMLSIGCLLRASRLECRKGANRWIILAGALSGFACGFKYTAVALVAIPAWTAIFIVFRCDIARRIRLAALFAIASVVTFSPWLIKNVAATGNPVFPLLGEWFDSYPPGWGESESAHFAAAHKPLTHQAGLTGRATAFWEKVVADPAHRFGAIMLALAAVGWSRHRSRIDAALWGVLLVQVLVWLFATHLYARFAVPMLIPLVLLAGRGTTNKIGTMSGGFAVVLIAGAVLNFFYAYILYTQHTELDGERFRLEGATSAFTEGYLTNQKHVGYVNQELPQDGKVLLVGEARAFYFKRKCDYCVVFNRNPFADAVEEATSPGEILHWLGAQGYTHVLVHYGEMNRLRGSYGFWEPLTPSLFAQLVDAGLIELERFSLDDGGAPYAIIYEVPRR